MDLQINLEKKQHYSPLRYPGGKTSLSSFFDQLIKANGLFDGTYIEPYAGGAGAAITLLLLEKIKHIVINDFDKAIYSFWKSSIYQTDDFIDMIQAVDVNVEEWQKQRAIYKNSKRAKCIELGFATFFLNRTNHSGVVEGWPIGGIEQNGPYKIDARFNKKDLIKRIRKISLYRDRITVTNLDGIEYIRNNTQDGSVFVYLDPPYYNKGSSLYLNHYTDVEHRRLASVLNENNNIKWVLTYDNVNEIKNLYPNRHKTEFSLNYSVNRKIKGSEVMIFSDALSLKSVRQA